MLNQFVKKDESRKKGNADLSRKKGKKHRSLSNFAIALILIAGICIMAYPSFSNYWNSLHQSRAIVSYNQVVSENDDEENERMWNEAKEYNERLAETGTDLSLTSKDDSDPQKMEYLSILDVTGTGIMGYVDIDSVHIHLPIYHDTTEAVLQVAVGHLAGTSLPVGGESTHAVLTGHTGLPSAKLFTDIDQLELGDTFQITVLDHVMTYEVDDIRTVLPDELDSLAIEEGKDLVTLVTCTPYGINTHRLLVTGHRIPNPVETDKPSGNWKYDSIRTLLLEAIPFVILAAAAILLVVVYRKKRNKTKRKEMKDEEKKQTGK